MSVMDSIEEKYEDEIAKLMAALAEKEKSILFWRREARLADARGDHADEKITSLEQQIAALTAERDKLREEIHNGLTSKRGEYGVRR